MVVRARHAQSLVSRFVIERYCACYPLSTKSIGVKKDGGFLCNKDLVFLMCTKLEDFMADPF